MVNRYFPKAFLLVWLLLSSCSFLTGAPGAAANRYYVLTEATDLREIARLPKLSLGVGPIGLPDYLDRLSIARRSDANRVVYAENDRWAESLGGNVQRILAADLSVLLFTERITLFPWYRTSAPDRRVAIAIQRFEVDPQGKVRLWARWVLRDQNGNRLVSGEFDERREVATNADAVAQAMSDLVGDLARSVAVVVAESV
jgi:uncharacterized lipoprotein YmbA